MTAEAPESLLSSGALDARGPDRRPAIWPWLVMPLITLTLFYCLHRLLKDAPDGEAFAPAQQAIHAPTEPTTP